METNLKNKKNIFITILVAVIFIGGYLVGNYFVNYAIKRGTVDDPLATPAACASIHDPNRQEPTKPEALNEQWQIQSADGLKLVATHFSPATSSQKWIILVHGYGRNQRYVWDYVPEYLKHGYNVLTPDMRAAGESDGQYLTMGTLESGDVARWTQEIVNHNKDAEISLHGISMGAATVLMAAARADCANLTAVIEDCGYTSAYDMFTKQLEILFGLPSFPIMNCVDVVSKIQTDVYLSEAAPIKVIKNVHVPILFIHGDADTLVPIEMMNELFETAELPFKEQLITKDAGHGDSMSVNQSLYFDTVFKFLQQAQM